MLFDNCIFSEIYLCTSIFQVIISSSSSSSTANSPATPTITSNRHGGQVFPHHFCLLVINSFSTCFFSDRFFPFLSLVILILNPLFLFQGWMGSGYNLDPAKIGQEGYNLLKYYEQQLKALQVQSRSTICSVMILRLNVG